MMKRSGVVIIVGALFVLGGINGMLAPFAAKIVSESGILPPEQQGAIVNSWLTTPIGYIYSIALGLLSILAGIGLFMLKNWARVLVLVLALFSLLQGSSGMLLHMKEMLSQPMGMVTLPLGLISVVGWNGVILWYFLKPSVKAQFVKVALSNQHPPSS